MVFADLPFWFYEVFGTIFGLLWGSFLNVVIYRLPRGMNVAYPPSHCPGCGKPIAPYDNIPVVSYLVLRGRARCCKTPMSPRYPIVELLGGLLAYAILETQIAPLAGQTSIFRVGAVFLASFMVCLAMLACVFIDAEHAILPDELTLPSAVIGLATATLRGFTLKESLTGAVFGYVVVWLPLIVVYARLRGREGMGRGDAKLTMMAGAWFGWKGALFMLFAGAVQGTLGALFVWIARGRLEVPEGVREDHAELVQLAAEGDEEAKKELESDPLYAAPGTEPKAWMPFGPFLILAFYEYLLARDVIFDALDVAFEWLFVHVGPFMDPLFGWLAKLILRFEK